jgi:hypothetical protein
MQNEISWRNSAFLTEELSRSSNSCEDRGTNSKESCPLTGVRKAPPCQHFRLYPSLTMMHPCAPRPTIF